MTVTNLSKWLYIRPFIGGGGFVLKISSHLSFRISLEGSNIFQQDYRLFLANFLTRSFCPITFIVKILLLLIYLLQ